MKRSYLEFGRDRNREKVRQKYKNICQQCGYKWQIGERRLDCHHKIGCGILTRSYDKLNTIKGLKPYCHSCHLRLESVIKKMGIKEFDSNKRIKRNIEIMALNGTMPRIEISKKYGISTQMIYMIINKLKGWSNRNY